MDLSFAVHKLEKFSSKPGKLNFEGLVHLLRCIRENKTLGLIYYADMNDAPVSDLLIQDGIKNDNKLMDFSDYSWQGFPETGRSTRAYIIFYEGGKIEPVIYGPGPVSQSGA